jgi:hypothetical protein
MREDNTDNVDTTLKAVEGGDDSDLGELGLSDGGGPGDNVDIDLTTSSQ